MVRQRTANNAHAQKQDASVVDDPEAKKSGPAKKKAAT
jgi:hypothetical protein